MIKRKLGRKRGHRVRMLNNLAISVILYEKVKTTESKAKEAKSLVERYINLGKKADLVTRRRLLGRLNDPKAVAKVLEILSPRYKNMTSPVRIFKIGSRLGDAAPMAIIQLKEIEEKSPETDKTIETKKNGKTKSSKNS